MSHTLQPYPTDIREPAKLMLEKVRGGDVPLACAVHAAYQVIGVGLGTALPDDDNVGYGDTIWDRPDGMKSCPPDECEKVLAEAAGENGVKGILDGPLAKKLLAIALQLLTQWLAGG